MHISLLLASFAKTPKQTLSFSIMSVIVTYSMIVTFSNLRTASSKVDVISFPVISSWNKIRGLECAPSRV